MPAVTARGMATDTGTDTATLFQEVQEKVNLAKINPRNLERVGNSLYTNSKENAEEY